VSNNRVPLEAFWDQGDKRLLAVETEYVKDLSKGTTLDDAVAGTVTAGGAAGAKPGLDNIKLDEIENDFKGKTAKEDEFQGKSVETFFVTSDFKVKKQSTINFEEGDETMLGV